MVIIPTMLSRAAGATAALFMLSHSGVNSQMISDVCEGELGEANWECDVFEPVPEQAFAGQELLLPLPGSPNPANPTRYQQISGTPVTFDPTTGERNDDDGSAAVFAITEGAFWCMLAESNGEAVLFDAPEGEFVNNGEQFGVQFPAGTWLPESIEALLAPGTMLKYIAYSTHDWDHIGAAGFVYEHFIDHEPMVIAPYRTRADIKAKNNRGSSVLGNTRGVPVPETMVKELDVGALRFTLERTDALQSGDMFAFLDKELPQNAEQGIDSSVLMIVDMVVPGWTPAFSVSFSTDIGNYFDALDEILALDFDVLLSGHLTRLGTKEDVQNTQDFMNDVLQGAVNSLEEIPGFNVVLGTGVQDPTNANFVNLWFFINELFNRQVDVCESYVLNQDRNWVEVLGGVEITLRSHCFAILHTVRVG